VFLGSIAVIRFNDLLYVTIIYINYNPYKPGSQESLDLKLKKTTERISFIFKE